MLLSGRVVAALLTVLIMLPPVTNTARAVNCENAWVFLAAGPSNGVRAQISLGDAQSSGNGYQNAYVSLGGDTFLSIIQVGARVRSDGSTRLFAAWGRGIPNGVGSLYEERDLGPVDRGSHAYAIQLVASGWAMTVDGNTLLQVPDDFRTWPIRSSRVAVEAEYPNRHLGGTPNQPVIVHGALIDINGWQLPAQGSYGPASWAQGSACTGPLMQQSFGPDWLRVWEAALRPAPTAAPPVAPKPAPGLTPAPKPAPGLTPAPKPVPGLTPAPALTITRLPTPTVRVPHQVPPETDALAIDTTKEFTDAQTHGFDRRLGGRAFGLRWID